MANYSDTEIQRIFEEAERKAELWAMPTNSNQAEIDSLTDDLAVSTLEEDNEIADPSEAEDMKLNTGVDEYDDVDKVSSEEDDELKPTEKPEGNVMSQEEIEAMIKSGPTNSELPTENSTVAMDGNLEKSVDTQPQEKLSSSQIEDMFDQQSSSISVPETEEQSELEEVEEDSNKLVPETGDLEDHTDDNSIIENKVDETSGIDASEASPDSEEKSASEDLEASIKRKKLEQQLAKADLQEMDIAALFNKNDDNPSDPTSVLSQDNFRQNIQILDMK